MEEKRERFELLTALYDVALKGDVSSLKELEQQDKSILDRCRIEKSGHFTQSPLHVAVNLGHLEFTKEILLRKPQLAEQVDHIQRSTPLHLAAATKDQPAQPGNSSAATRHLEIVKALIEVNPTTCLARNKDGWNPIHVAAIRGEPCVLEELLQAQPQAARELTNRGETVLHLCVKHKKAETLESLVEAMDDVELLNAKDILGNTILHLAVATRQLETVNFLLEDERMEKNVINANGYTAMDICQKVRGKNSIDQEIRDCLEGAKALPGKAAKRLQERDRTWSPNQHDALMVVESLIATMAFQVAMSPPGGVWQNNDTLHNVTTYNYCGPILNQTITTVPGKAIFGYIDSIGYRIYLVSNALAFASSASVILLLISGFQYKRYFSVTLTIIMWIALSATTVTYWFGSCFVLSSVPFPGLVAYDVLMSSSLKAWVILLACLFLGHGIRAIKNSKLGRSTIRKLHFVKSHYNSVGV